MPSRNLSPSEVAGIVDRVLRLTAQCGSVKAACQEAGIAPATYYRYRKSVGGHVLPALRKDWYQLAREWECFVFGQLSPVEASHLRYEVANAVDRCFGLPSRARETDIRDQLRRLDKALCEVFSTYDDIGRDARGLVDEIHGSTGAQLSFASLVDRLRPLARQVTELAKGMEEIAEETGAARGGRDHDSRIDGLIVALATLYAWRIRKPPYHTICHDDGEPSSEFNIFVDDVFRHFLLELEVPPNALIEAMRHAAARIDYSDDVERRD